jgi:hypothetical protein
MYITGRKGSRYTYIGQETTVTNILTILSGFFQVIATQKVAATRAMHLREEMVATACRI